MEINYQNENESLKLQIKQLELEKSQIINELMELKQKFDSNNEEKEIYKSIFLIKNIEELFPKDKSLKNNNFYQNNNAQNDKTGSNKLNLII